MEIGVYLLPRTTYVGRLIYLLRAGYNVGHLWLLCFSYQHKKILLYTYNITYEIQIGYACQIQQSPDSLKFYTQMPLQYMRVYKFQYQLLLCMLFSYKYTSKKIIY